MKSSKSWLWSTRALLMGVAGLLLGTGAIAQTSDFPTYKGDPARTGKNGTPNLQGPGLTNLRWFYPYGDANTTTVIVDNTDEPDTSDFIGGPYTPNPYGETRAIPPFKPDKSSYDSDVEWAAAPQELQASGPYTLTRRTEIVAGNAIDANLRVPNYIFTRATPSLRGDDPIEAEDNTDRRFFEWTLAGPTNIFRNYAIYVWLPVGPTRFNNPVTPILYPQRYYTYEIRYGNSNSQRFVDIVDTYESGGGWVRLGNGGAPTNRVFPYAGTRIRVRLYNTAPRDEDGNPLENTNPRNRLVYADAVRAIPTIGNVTATPTVAGFGQSDVRAVSAVSQTDSFFDSENRLVTRTRGTLTSFNHNFSSGTLANNMRWSYSPFNTLDGEGDRDNESAEVTKDPNWVLGTNARFNNGDFRYAPITTNDADKTRVVYSPTLTDGQYEVYMFMPGPTGTGLAFGRRVQVNVKEGDRDNIFFVNQAPNRGWVRLGNRRYRHAPSATPPLPLSVTVTNFSQEPGDVGRFAMADAMRFIGETSTEIRSTPTQALARVRLNNNSVVERRVVISADESGRIYCLDAEGRPDGGTDPYWVYPSYRRNGFVDPNLVEGIDGPASPAPTEDTAPVAQMPNGFDLSTAVVRRIGGEDYLYIAAKNGRVYCLEMAGRGDYNWSNRLPGTTRRVWSYPSDYPGPRPAGLRDGFGGSVAVVDTASGPTVIVPAAQGRIYALEALPTDPLLRSDRRTRERWTYPLVTAPTVGNIGVTPSVEFGRVYFGTRVTDDAPGQFFAVNADTGALEWTYDTPSNFSGGDFVGSPATASGALVGTGVDTVYTANSNRFIYALNAATGQMIWQTNELSAPVSGALTFTVQSVFDGSALDARVNAPVVVAPISDGRVVSLFAANGTNRFGTKRAWQYITAGDEVRASVSAGHNFMYAADNLGFLYAFSNVSGSPITPGQIPGQDTIVENNLRGDVFREARIGYINKATFDRLRLPDTDSNALQYSQVINPTTREILPAFRPTRTVFEWGETIYVFAYDYPFVTEDLSAPPQLISAPQANFSFSSEGTGVRQIPVESRRFRNPETAPINATESSLRNDAFAVLPYTLQGGGPTALPPGNGNVTLSIATAYFGGDPARASQAAVALNPAYSQITFGIANPIAIAMQVVDPNQANPTPVNAHGIGLSPFSDNPQNLVNGSPNVAGGATRPGDPISSSLIDSVNEGRLVTSSGLANHNARTTARLYVADRSMMGLLRPDGAGLDGIRFDRRAMVWQGAGGTVYRALNPTLYPNFEDLPNRFPNTSLDYPDMGADTVRVTKDPNGAAENPVFGPISLSAPLINDGGTLRPVEEGDDPDARILRLIPFDIAIDVPRFQPANDLRGLTAEAANAARFNAQFGLRDSEGNVVTNQGYAARMSLFVDSSNNGALDTGAREAYRSFFVATQIAPDIKFSVTTPTVDASTNLPTLDIGSLPGGAGYGLAPNGTNRFNLDPSGSWLSPWGGRYRNSFQIFTLLNEGNVNLLDMRLAKAQLSAGAANPTPMAANARANDPQSWLDGTLDIWANFDAAFAPVGRFGPNNAQVVQKARVGDSAPTLLKVNPTPRENPQLPSGQSFSGGVPADQEPKLGVSVPIGFPVGQYQALVRIIENDEDPARSNEIWDFFLDANSRPDNERYSEPLLSLNFTVREARLTNRGTQNGATLLESLVDVTPTPRFAYQNAAPALFRDPLGSLVLAWTSDRPQANPSPGTPSGPGGTRPWRIFLASLANPTSFSDSTLTPPGDSPNPLRELTLGNRGFSPLRDLSFFARNSDEAYFRKATASASGYPAAGTDWSGLFGVAGLTDSAVRFHSPAFSTSGRLAPFGGGGLGTAFGNVLMAFVGEATTGGRVLSRLFVAQVSIDAQGHVAGISAPVALAGDSQTLKSRPAIVQTGNDSAIIVYPGTQGSTTVLYAVNYTAGSFGAVRPLPFGRGFESVTGLSATGRIYRDGASPLLEVAFTGRVRGATAAEPFLGRLGIDPGTGTLPVDASGNLTDPWLSLGLREDELLSTGTARTLRTPGVRWDVNSGVELQMRRGNEVRNLLVPGTQSIDAETGLISFESTLGGRISLDPNSGLVRFSGALPPRTYRTVVRYAPRFLRAGSGIGAADTPTVVGDRRLASDTRYWSVPGGTQPIIDRLTVAYGRTGVAGSGARPVMKTYRLGINLPAPVLTAENGQVVSLTTNLGSVPFEVDPVNGRVYFTAPQEDQEVTIQYTSAAAGTGQSGGTVTTSGRITWIEESAETPITIEQAVNESAPAMVVDPFRNAGVGPRPFLLWMVWSSTRAGVSDLYFQSIAPRLSAVPIGK